jgi:hypothetical protein
MNYSSFNGSDLGHEMNTSQVIEAFNSSAKKVFGADISVLVARSPAFGDNDFCFVVTGDRQGDVALALSRLVSDSKVSRDSTNFFGAVLTSTTVEGRQIPDER